MYITFARSSSLNNLDYCEMQYFLTYNLGLYNAAGTKAAQGTAAHKVLECLAIGKKYIQENPDKDDVVIDDESLGRLVYSRKDFFEERELDILEINDINKSRINKQVFKYECFLKKGVVRMGEKVMADLIEKSTDLYSSKNKEPFTRIERKQVANFCWLPLEWNNGEFDPRKRIIHAPEKNFEIPIDEEWAFYHYIMKGEDVIGQFAIKGTIDLVTKIDDNTLEIIDWKTGQRLNWATGKVKTYEDLCKDKQLLLYYYAAKKVFPEFKNIIITIFFVRDGGPYTISFDEDDIKKMEKILAKHFSYVQSCDKPGVLSHSQKDFRCEKLCDYYKNKQPGSEMNMCNFFKKEIAMKGMETVIDEHVKPGFALGTYNSPGE